MAQVPAEGSDMLKRDIRRVDKWFSSFEIGVRQGLLMASEADGWGSARDNSIKNDVFLKNSPHYGAPGITVSSGQQSILQPFFQLEGLLGLQLRYLPGFKKMNGVEKVQSVRVGGHLYVAPFGGRTTLDKSIPTAFYDANLQQTQNFTAKVTTTEDSLIVSPGISLFYFHEKGLGDKLGASIFGQRKLIPYGGIELGLGIVTGKRKTLMATNPIADGSFFVRNSATLQENFLNNFGFRANFLLGTQYHILQGQMLELRLGYQLLSISADITRVGNFTQTKTDAAGNTVITYSRDVLKKSDTNDFSHSGFVLTIGYTIGLF